MNLELGEGPVYISGGTLDQFAAGKFDAVFTPDTLSVVPGGTLNVKIRLPEHLADSAKLRLQPFRAAKESFPARAQLDAETQNLT